jgi:hypothetical protein
MIGIDNRTKSTSSLLPVLLFLLSLMGTTPTALAQGSIFGTLRNSDSSTPAAGEVSFFGYLDDTDEEMRIESSVGAGYDAGNWFDDFQNYLTEAAGNPYAYHFSNSSISEGFVLSGAIPNNSFQQENVALSPVPWPQTPTGLQVDQIDGSGITVAWDYDPELTYHVYRRLASSGGSFFRVDDPSGSMQNHGVASGSYLDSDTDTSIVYDYLIIAEDASGNLSAHSSILNTSVPSYVCGDADGNGAINISDAVFLVAYIFGGGYAPDPYLSGDTDCTGTINISDAVYLVAYIFGGGGPPCASCPQ